jgi:acyl dehydratase
MTLEEVIQKNLGMRGEVTVARVDKSSIQRHLDAVGDSNPMWQDEEYARSFGYIGLPAPPSFFGRNAKAGGEFPKMLMDLVLDMSSVGHPVMLDGGIQYEFYRPVYAGDTLASSLSVDSMTPKTTKAGKSMVVVQYSAEFINQNGEKVAKATMDLLCASL